MLTIAKTGDGSQQDRGRFSVLTVGTGGDKGTRQGTTEPSPCPVMFSITARGKNISYRWQCSTDGGTTWADCTAAFGYDTADLSVGAYTHRMGDQYRCIITDIHGNTVTSEAATLSWAAVSDSAIEITAHPADFTGTIGSTASFSVTASGSGLTYQWQYSTDGGATWQAAASTAATLSTAVTAASAGYLSSTGDGSMC